MKGSFNSLRKHIIRFLKWDTRGKSEAVKFERIIAENYSGVKKNHESKGKNEFWIQNKILKNPCLNAKNKTTEH